MQSSMRGNSNTCIAKNFLDVYKPDGKPDSIKFLEPGLQFKGPFKSALGKLNKEHSYRNKNGDPWGNPLFVQLLAKASPKTMGKDFKNSIGWVAIVEWKVERICAGNWSFRNDAECAKELELYITSVTSRAKKNNSKTMIFDEATQFFTVKSIVE